MNKQLEQLESLIDLVGLKTVLGEISQICYEKAEHINTNWQDSYTANLWNRAGDSIIKLTESREIKEAI